MPIQPSITADTIVVTIKPGEPPIAETASDVAASDVVLVVQSGQPLSVETGADVLAALAPQQPTGLTVSDIAQTSLTASWATVPNATAYALALSMDAGATWTPLTIATTETAGIVSTPISGLPSGATVALQLVASNVDGNSPPTVLSGVVTEPATPIGLAGGSITQTSLVLTWPTEPGASSLTLEMSAAGGAWATLPDPIESPYAVSGLIAATSYDFRLTASDVAGASGPEVLSGVTTEVAVPDEPIGLAASAITQTTLTLSWQMVAGVTYVLEASPAGANTWTPLSATATSPFAVTGRTAATSYDYRLTPSDAAGPGQPEALSGVVMATATPDPTGVQVLAITANSVQIGWTVDPAVKYYYVQDETAPIGSWATVAVGLPPYTITGLTSGSSYKVRILGYYGAAGFSPGATSVVSVTTTGGAPPPPPAMPTGFQTASIGATSVVLSWTAVAGLTYALSEAGGATTQNATSPFTVSGLALATSYTFQLTATNSAVVSGPPASLTVTTQSAAPPPPAVPTGVALVSATTTAATVEWNTIVSLIYTVEVTPGGTTTNAVSPFTASGLLPSTAYTFQVSAQNAAGTSALSAPLSVATQAVAPPPVSTWPASPTGSVGVRLATNFGAGAAPAGAAYTMFHAFAPGAIPAGSVPQMSVGGTAIPATVSNRVTNPDGSLRSAVFDWVHPKSIAPGALSDLLSFAPVVGIYNDTAYASIAGITAGHDYKLQILSNAVVYTLSFNANAASAVAIRSGPTIAGFKVHGNFVDPSGTPHAQLWGKFWAYLTPAGIRLEHEVYANKIANSTAVAITSATLLDGATVLQANATPFTLYTRNKLAMYDADGRSYNSGADMSEVVWAYPHPVKSDASTTGLFDALITWWHAWSPSYIDGFPAPLNVTYGPNTNLAAIFPDGVDGTGNHDFLGTMTSVAVMAMLDPTYARHRHDRLMALGSWGVCAYWCADASSGLPPVFTNTTYPGLSAPITSVGWGLAATLSMTGGNNPATTNDASHAGLWWWWQYLSTGSEQALENMMEQSVGVLGCDAPGSGLYQRNPLIGTTHHYGSYAFFSQPRAVAWEIRNLSNTHWVCPDNHLMKSYLNDLVQVQYDVAAAGMNANAATWGPLAFWGANTTSVWTTVDGVQYGYSEDPWMNNYRVTSVTMDYRRGRITLSHPTMVHVVKHCYGFLVDGNMFNGAGAYRAGTMVGPNPVVNSPLATQWGQVYGFQDPPNSLAPLIDNPPVLSGLRDQSTMALAGGSDLAPPPVLPNTHTFVGHTYPNIAICAAACGVIAGELAGPTSDLAVYAGKVVAYLAPLIDAPANAPEAMWGSTGGAQAWRIRPPA